MRPLTALAALTLAAAPAAAVEPTLGAALGTEPGQIAAALAEESYDMTRFVALGDRIEVTAVREDSRLDLVLDAATGEVVALEAGRRRGAPGRAGLDDAEIRDMIAAEGYRITEYERERGRIEIYATKDGRRWELEVDPMTGRILRVESES